FDGGENIAGEQRDLLEAGAAESVEKARRDRRAAVRDVERDAHVARRAAQGSRKEGAVRIGDFDLRLAAKAEHRFIEQGPGQEFAAADDIREMIDLA